MHIMSHMIVLRYANNLRQLYGENQHLTPVTPGDPRVIVDP